MLDENEKIIRDRFERLPKGVKDFISSEKFDENVESIRSRNDLPIEKLTPLGNESLLFALGLVDADDFVSNLEESLEIDGEKAGVLAGEIYDSLIVPVEGELLGFLNSEKTRGVEKPTPTPPSNLPTSQKILEPMVVSKDQNPFLPPLRKISSQPEYYKKNEEKPMEKVAEKIVENERPTKPQMTSELAAEIRNLLDKKSSEADDVSNNKSSYVPPKNPEKPEDKFSEVAQKPRIEVQMVKKDQNEVKGEQLDPYREPVE